MAAVKPSPPPISSANRRRKELARDQEGAELHHALDGELVEAVAVVDDVDACVERHVDGLAVGDVTPHQRAPLVRRLDAGRELGSAHLHLLPRRHRAVASGDEHLDDLRPLLDLLAHRPGGTRRDRRSG